MNKITKNPHIDLKVVMHRTLSFSKRLIYRFDKLFHKQIFINKHFDGICLCCISISYIIKFSLFMCLSVSMSVRNSLPNHAYYSDEAFTGDTVGLGQGQRLNFILKKLILKYFWGKIALAEKNTVYISSRCSSSHLLIFVMSGD